MGANLLVGPVCSGNPDMIFAAEGDSDKIGLREHKSARILF